MHSQEKAWVELIADKNECRRRLVEATIISKPIKSMDADCLAVRIRPRILVKSSKPRPYRPAFSPILCCLPPGQGSMPPVVWDFNH